MKRFLFSLVAFLLATHVGFAQPTPEEAVKRFAVALEAGNTTELLGLLPPSYVSDVGGLVNQFATRMDNEVWNRLRKVLTTTATTLGPKAHLFVEMGAQGEEVAPAVKADRAKAVKAVLDAVGALARNDITSLDRMKTVELATFATEVGTLFSSATSAMKALEADVPGLKAGDFEVLRSVPGDDGSVELTIKGPDDADPETVKMVQVEGRWVPAEMAAEWSETMAGARAGLQEIDFTTPEGQQTKAQMLMMMNMLEPMIQQLGQAETVGQLQEMAGGLLMPLMMLGAGGGM